MRKIEMISVCKKDHICSFCGNKIKKGDVYFKLLFLNKANVYSAVVLPVNKNWPKKCCYTCLPKIKDIFLCRQIKYVKELENKLEDVCCVKK